MDKRVDPKLVERFRADFERSCPRFPLSDGRVGVAVSGGPDSLALLILLHAILPQYSVRVATVDHQLRPESAGEAKAVASICEALEVSHDILTVEVDDSNVQRGAREARYYALCDWASGLRLNCLMTAHHADDQAETVLMRLNRGSGVFGLSGIRQTRWLQGRKQGQTEWLVRPLLSWRKTDLERIVEASPFDPVNDPSNRNLDFDRVAMRERLKSVPWLDVDAIARSAANLAEAASYIDDELTTEVWSLNVRDEGEKIRYIPVISRFANIEIVRDIVERLGTAKPRSEIGRMIDRLQTGQSANLGGVLARVGGEEWVFTPEPPRRTG